MAVIVVAWGAPSLIDKAPDSAGAVVRREAPATAGPRPIAAPQVSTTAADRGGDQEARLVEPMPPPVPAADFEIPTSSEGPQGEAVTASSTAPRTGQSETAPQPAAASAQPIRIAQSAPAPAIPAPATPAPAIPAPAAPRAAPSALTANQPQGALLPATETPARWISGGLQNSDNGKGRFEGVVGVRIVVRPDGRAGGCRVTESSGNPRLDEVTCRLVGPRLMFSPARDATGRAIESEVGGQYVWGRRTRQRSLFGIKF